MSGKAGLLYKQMPATRRKILNLLKEHEALTADELAEALSISSVAIRRHLTKLESDRLVTYKEIQRGMGRPSFVYELGEAAVNFFPRRYEELALSTLETIKDMYGNEALDAIFEKQSEHTIEQYQRRIDGESLEERLDQLTKLREGDGYMSSWEKSNEQDIFILREMNCPIIHVAEECESACSCDQVILENVLDADVTRISHMAIGDGSCAYTVQAKNK
ncbi:MAG: metalloregulator ArsR/SmtB family transcription factor [Chloroflexota bacterium]